MDWEWEERVWQKQVENELMDIKGMIKFIHEKVIRILHGMKMNIETLRQVWGMVEKLLKDDDEDDEDDNAMGSAAGDLVPMQGTEDMEMRVVAEAAGEEKVDLEKEVGNTTGNPRVFRINFVFIK